MVQTSSQSTVNKIEMRLRGKGRGSIVFQQDYADCGTPSAVKSTFHRMYTDGMLMRLAHGIYYYPKEDKEYGLGIIYPSVEDIAQAIAKRDKVQIQPTGVTALNKLGLSTQVPTKYTYLTSGSGRVLTLGNRTIVLKRSVPKNFAFRTMLAALLVQALRTLGQKNVGDQELATIRKLANEETHKDLFIQDLALMPVWMRKLITDIIDKNERYDTLVKSHNR